MRIEHHRVGALDPPQQPSTLLGEQEEPAVRGVHVVPAALPRGESAIASSGSTAPVSVVPAAAMTSQGRSPAARSAAMASASASGRMR